MREKKGELEEWIPVTLKLPLREFNKLMEAVDLSKMTRSEVCRVIIVNGLIKFIEEYDHNGVRAEINNARLARLSILNFFEEILEVVYPVYLVHHRDTGIPERCHELEALIEEGKLNRRLIEEIISYTNGKLLYLESYLPEDARTLEKFIEKIKKYNLLETPV